MQKCMNEVNEKKTVNFNSAHKLYDIKQTYKTMDTMV